MRRVITIRGISDRNRLHSWVDAAPVGYRVAFKEPSRSLEQNSRMWAILDQIAQRAVWYGQHYAKEDWKDYFMHMLKGGRWMPGEDGELVPIGRSTSKLTVSEMTDLQTLMEAFCARYEIEIGDSE
jgi:hypothetical protein